MGVMVVLTLVYKRYREKPKRKWKIWMFDVSKQLVGQIVVHFANVFISDFGADQAVQNPCVLYFLNIVVDTTVGVGIIYLFLWGTTKVLTEQFHVHGLQTGQYGDGPKPSIKFWARQAAVYVFCLLGMKVVVVLLFAIWPGIFAIGEWLLSWTGNSDTVQVVVVMGICPIVFNMLQFWLIDSIVKARDSLDSLVQNGGFVPSREEDEDIHAPLFTDNDNDDEYHDATAGITGRRRSRDLERGIVSPQKRPRSTSTEGLKEPKAAPLKEDTAHAGSSNTSTERRAFPIKQRSPPPSPAYGTTPTGEDTDDDWGAWDDEDESWNAGAGNTNPWAPKADTAKKPKPKSRSNTTSPKRDGRRLSLTRMRSEGHAERTASGTEDTSFR